MSTPPTVTLVIPCFNEEENLSALWSQIEELCISFSGISEVIFINDASTDSTLTLLSELSILDSRIYIINNNTNCGCHMSVKKGFDVGKGEWLIFLPSDLQILPSVVNDLIPYFASSDFIATWRIDRKDPRHRRYISRVYNLVIRLITGVYINDFDSSIAIRNSLYRGISCHLRTTTASLAVEIAAYSVRNGARIAEVPIAHYPRVAGTARGLNWRDTLAAPIHLLNLWFRLRLKRERL